MIQPASGFRSSVDALLKWNIVVMYCAVHKLKKSTVFLRHCAEDNNWLMFLTFAQLHQYPKDIVCFNFPSKNKFYPFYVHSVQ